MPYNLLSMLVPSPLCLTLVHNSDISCLHLGIAMLSSRLGPDYADALVRVRTYKALGKMKAIHGLFFLPARISSRARSYSVIKVPFCGNSVAARSCARTKRSRSIIRVISFYRGRKSNCESAWSGTKFPGRGSTCISVGRSLWHACCLTAVTSFQRLYHSTLENFELLNRHAANKCLGPFQGSFKLGRPTVLASYSQQRPYQISLS